MDAFPTYDNIPWDLIAVSLQGEPSVEEQMQLQQWVALSPDNGQLYEQLRLFWQKDLADYDIYRKADTGVGWLLLQERMGHLSQKQEGGKIIRGAFNKKLIRLLTIAAVFLLFAGVGYWYLFIKNTNIVYETAGNVQKRVALPDGSTILLKAQTRVLLAKNYNTGSRTVTLTDGEAFFEVQHREQLPFIVNMDVVSVRDIGTSFTVNKAKDSIKVVVSSGKVAFSNNETGETKEIPAGNAICFYTAKQHFNEMVPVGSANNPGSLLQFDNTPLSEVTRVLQKVYGRNIILSDTDIAQKRFTAHHLEGESFNNTLKVICASLSLEYTEKDGIYTLKKKVTATGN